MNSRVIQATLLLIGTIVGVGMFGIPFQFVRAGFLTGALELGVLAVAVTLVHLAYAEVVLRIPSIHRLPGYVASYLGRGAGTIAAFSYLFGLSGALLAYLVLGGFFLGTLLREALPALDPAVGPIVFYLFGVGVIFRSIRFESLTNAILTSGLVLATLALAISLLPALDTSVLPAFDARRLAVPYGVILFSLAGSAIIPDMRRLLVKPGAASFRRIITLGSLVPAGLYLLFAAAVVGVSGEATSPDAISGLAERFGPVYLLVGSLIGFLATITSFITLGLVLEGMFISDFGIKPRVSWVLVAAIPASLYLLGFQDFIAIISLVGAVAIGLDSIFILFVHQRIQASVQPSDFRIVLPDALRAILILIFVAGILYELFSFLTPFA